MVLKNIFFYVCIYLNCHLYFFLIYFCIFNAFAVCYIAAEFLYDGMGMSVIEDVLSSAFLLFSLVLGSKCFVIVRTAPEYL